MILGVGVSAGIALLVVVLMRFFPVCVVWVSLIAVISTFIVLGFIFMYNGGGILDKQNQIGRLGIPSFDPSYYYNVWGGICFGTAVCIAIIFVCYCGDIHFAISMTKVAN